ncbi:hypothetical protein RCO48_28960 [Peribacillus frigoritolerans]|nr:hypothetical protein [Peribacillus frigoritolerans]
MPELSLEVIISLLPVAFTIALLGGVESLLSATVADNMGGEPSMIAIRNWLGKESRTSRPRSSAGYLQQEQSPGPLPI